jgi:hypothetical protein
MIMMMMMKVGKLVILLIQVSVSCIYYAVKKGNESLLFLSIVNERIKWDGDSSVSLKCPLTQNACLFYAMRGDVILRHFDVQILYF